MRRADLQDVGNMQADQKLNTLVSGDAHVASGPQLIPRPCVMVEGLGEWLAAVDGLYGIGQRLVYSVVTRSVEGNHLFDAHRNSLFGLEGQHLVDVVLHLVEATVHVYNLVLPVDPGARRLGYIHVGMAGWGPAGG